MSLLQLKKHNTSQYFQCKKHVLVHFYSGKYNTNMHYKYSKDVAPPTTTDIYYFPDVTTKLDGDISVKRSVSTV